MEEGGNRGDLLGHILRPSSLRTGGGTVKSTSSGRTTPRSSFRRSNSSRTPRRDNRGSASCSQCFRSNRIVLWLLLITLWAYAGFYVQSKWAHEEKKEGLFGKPGDDDNPDLKDYSDKVMVGTNSSLEVKFGNGTNESILKNVDVVLTKKENASPARRQLQKKKPSKKVRVSRRKQRGKVKTKVEYNTTEPEVQEPEIRLPNSTYGLVVGPFGSLEDTILGWSPEKRSGTCDRKGKFARLVWSRKFLLIFHELSMTGAPLSMMELATEILSCGATVSAVVLSRKGGLMPELSRRKITVLEDRADSSFKVAWKVDLVIAGSAVCSSWIEQYLTHYPAASNRIVWWIMENRKEYFDRSKPILNRVRMLIFLSESQSKQWEAWCKEENTTLSQTSVVPLSVNNELAFPAGIASSLNTPMYSTKEMLEKRKLLRNAVREQMGLKDNDMLVLSLSSINPGKGQLLLIESTRIQLEKFRHLNARKLGSENEGIEEPTLKILIGSVGSKSNKAPYVEALLNLISRHSNLSNSVLWTPVTTRVASLYSAADVYVINSQGLGETFGRVTIEAMAFGLPVLGTDAGGTKDLVEHNVTGLLHPLGRPGAQDLSKNLNFLLQNPSARHDMGMMGRKKVQKMYLKRHMYKNIGEVLIRCMRLK